MLPRQYIDPPGHWKLGLDVANNSQGIRCTKHIFIAGQVDIDGRARVVHPDDMGAQVEAAMVYVRRVLEGAKADMADLVKLTAFYVPDGQTDEAGLASAIGAAMGEIEGLGPVLALVPVPGLAFPGMTVEIEGWAMRGANGERLPRQAAWRADGPRLPRPFSQAVRCEEMIFTSLLTSVGEKGEIQGPGSEAEQCRIVLPKLDALLAQLGADLQDVVKANSWFAEPGNQEAWAEPALIRGSFYREPGPAATGISLPALGRTGLAYACDAIAMRAVDGARMPRTAVWPEGHWDWPVHLPYRHGLRVGDLVFLGGQVPLALDASVLARGDMIEQTKISMAYIGKVLAELGLGFKHVVKVNSFYKGDVGPEVLAPNAETRFRHFPKPGPTSTGVPVPWLSYEGMLTEIDVVAMV